MVQGENIEVASTRLSPADPIVTEAGEEYIHFMVSSLSRGDIVDIRLSSLSRDNNPLFIIVAVATVVIIGFAVYFLRKRKVHPLSPTE